MSELVTTVLHYTYTTLLAFLILFFQFGKGYRANLPQLSDGNSVTCRLVNIGI